MPTCACELNILRFGWLVGVCLRASSRTRWRADCERSMSDAEPSIYLVRIRIKFS